nr:unnamed protein product [Digitaria exilis]
MSPLDEQGHGSHTASTAAGQAVGNPKVCLDSACHEMDILAACDDAIADGVDVISMSIATRFPSLYFKSAEAIGSFHAMTRGVVTSATTGNSGLSGSHVCNVAPWMLSVAASTIDRRFVDKIVLGNGRTVVVRFS